MADLVVPTLGESIAEAVVSKWLVNVGDEVEADEPVVDLETDKVNMQITAPVSGALTEQRAAEGDTVRVGDIVGQLKSGAVTKKARTKTSTEAPAAAPPSPQTKAKTAPATSKPAAALGAKELDERDPQGRVLSPSRRWALRNGQKEALAPAPSARPETALSPSMRLEEQVPMTALRKRIAQRLVQAQQTSASLTTFNEVDMTAIIQLRKQYKDEFAAKHGAKLGFMSFAVKACASALAQFPGLNAEVRDESIVYKKFYDFGIAVGTPRGLVVPVLRGCDQLSFAGVELGINELAARAREGQLTMDDLTGGSFTITNGGIYGSMMSTPLLNFPQTGILGMHNIVERPMVVDGMVQVRPVMYLAVTYDHRVVDGQEAVSFLVGVKERMEAPERLLLGV